MKGLLKNLGLILILIGVVEFKYYRMKEAEKMLALSEPLPEHVEQVKRYGEDTKKKFPNYNVRTYVVYICANKGWKCWEV